jgi:hypothetical protein
MVLEFEATDEAGQTARERRVMNAYREAHDQLRAALVDVERGVVGSATPLSTLLSNLWGTHCDVRSLYERRAKQLERTFRFILASDAVSDEQRARIFAVLYGRTGVGRDPKTLSADERTIVEHYRQIDAAGKQMLRTLLAKLDGASVKAGVSDASR